MKKLLIASVSVLAISAGAAFAQSSTTGIDQEGSNSIASVDQIASSGGTNTAYVTQYGTETTSGGVWDGLNGVWVSKGVAISQNVSSLTSGKTATNTASVTQYSNTDGVSVIQGGVYGSNTAGVNQATYGSNNTASIVQDTGAAYGVNNTAYVTQNSTAWGSNNVALVHQH